MIIIINKIEIKINTNLSSGKQIEKELCNISFYFSQTNSTEIPLKFRGVCNDVGKIVNTTETQYFCNNRTVSPTEYNKLLGENPTCNKKQKNISICYCPKDYTGQVCENKIKTVCKFDSVLINLNV
jgi:hypothetical protein